LFACHFGFKKGLDVRSQAEDHSHTGHKGD
jgi:hypothetical protein